MHFLLSIIVYHTIFAISSNLLLIYRVFLASTVSYRPPVFIRTSLVPRRGWSRQPRTKKGYIKELLFPLKWNLFSFHSFPQETFIFIYTKNIRMIYTNVFRLRVFLYLIEFIVSYTSYIYRRYKSYGKIFWFSRNGNRCPWGEARRPRPALEAAHPRPQRMIIFITS